MRADRLKTIFWVQALIRKVEHDGGSAMMLRRGDKDAGAVLIVLIDRHGRRAILREAALGAGWERIAIESSEALEAYTDRQKRYDPDLWILEIEHNDISCPIEDTLPGRQG